MLRPNKIGYVILIGIEGKLCAISPKCRKEVTKTTDWNWTASVTSTIAIEVLCLDYWQKYVGARNYICIYTTFLTTLVYNM